MHSLFLLVRQRRLASFGNHSQCMYSDSDFCSSSSSGYCSDPGSPARPATAATFPDVGRLLARPFIQALAQRNVITGFADGTFRPDEPVDRAEFAAMIQKL